jgi:hypothetical protein
MRFEENTMLFGSDPTPRIVAIEMGDTGTVKVYRREQDGSTVCDIEPFHPFVWADGDVADLGMENAEKLAGDLKFSWLITVNSWKELIALRNGLKSAGRTFFALTDPVQHYLTHTGRTLFKEMALEDLKRLQLEVISLSGEGDLAQASQEHIASIAVSDNSGWEELILVDPRNADASEHAAIKRLTAIYQGARSGRDRRATTSSASTCRISWPARGRRRRSSIGDAAAASCRSRPSRLQIAEKTIDYPKFAVDGRHFVDTFLLAHFYDVGMRSLNGFERIDVAQHFGFCDSAEFSSLGGKELQRAYLDGDERYKKRALCAVRETRAVSELLSPSYFIQAQIFPYNYQDVIVRGNATRINALFLREYFRQRHAIPELPMVQGLRRRLHRDVRHRRHARCLALRHRLRSTRASCCSSIASRSPTSSRFSATSSPISAPSASRRKRACAPRRSRAPASLPRPPEHLQNPHQQLLRLPRLRAGPLRRFRRRRARHPDRPRPPPEDDRLAQLQRRASHRSRHRRHLLRPAARRRARGAPQRARKELPPGIEVELDEQFDAMFSYKAKNYALLTKEGEVIMKGGALKSRGLEKFQRVFLEEIIKLQMQGKPGELSALRDDYERRMRAGEMPIEMLMKTDTLQDSLEKYRQKIGAGGRNRAAAYELALGSGRAYKPGDQISYYIKATPKKVAAYEAAKLASDFDPQNRDENVDYYVGKLGELVKKFGGNSAGAAKSDAKQESLAL